MSEIYEALAAPFETTYQLRKGGVELDYLTLEQVVSRLNETLGVDGWSFEVREQGHDTDHCWAHGRLTAYFETRAVVREQLGECAVQRGMALGDSRKGAASDAIKKCASLLGVGLYLSAKGEKDLAQRAAVEGAARPTALPKARSYSEVWQDMPAQEEAEIGCADCGTLITPWRRKDGTTWSAQDVADYAQKKFGKTLCWSCGKRQTG